MSEMGEPLPDPDDGGRAKGENKRSNSKGRRQDVWTPWKTRLKAHQDGVIMAEVIYDHRKQALDEDRKCLLTASADGVMRLFDLTRTNPTAVQKLTLMRPPTTSKPGPQDHRGKPCRADLHDSVTAYAYDGRRPPMKEPVQAETPENPQTLPNLPSKPGSREASRPGSAARVSGSRRPSRQSVGKLSRAGSFEDVSKLVREHLASGNAMIFGKKVTDADSFFNALDLNGSGLVDRGEVEQGLQRLGIPAQPSAITGFIAKLDTSPDGLISRKEMKMWINKGKAPSSVKVSAVSKQVKELLRTGQRKLFGTMLTDAGSFFDAIDRDKSGFVDRAELQHAMRQLDMVMGPNDIEQFVNSMDGDENGRIDKVEVMNWLGEGFVNNPTANELAVQVWDAMMSEDCMLWDMPVHDARSFLAALDQNQSGIVELHELQDAIEELGINVESTVVEQFLEMLDLDHNGFITEQELMAWLGEAKPQRVGCAATVYGGYSSGRIAGWDAASGSLLMCLEGHTNPITAIQCCEGLTTGGLDESGAGLLSAAEDGTIRVWHVIGAHTNVGVPHCLFVLEMGHRNPVADFVLFPGARVVCASWDGCLRSLDLGRRACTNICQASQTGIRSLCAAPAKGAGDEPRIWVGTEDCMLACWEFPVFPGGKHHSGKEIISWRAHYNHVTGLRLWKDWVISTGEDRLTRVWSAADGTLLEEFYGHSGVVLTMCVSYTDRLLWTGSRDWTVRSWDLYQAEMRVKELAMMGKADEESLQYELAVSRVAQKAANKKANKKDAKKGDKKAAAGKKKKG